MNRRSGRWEGKDRSFSRGRRGVLPLLLLAALASGCSPRTAEITPQFRTQTLSNLREGSIVLDCKASCSWSWVNERQGLRALDAAGEWQQLAVKVAQIGYQKDLAYYYLGRSAEGLGYPAAARRFYRESLELATGSNPGPQCRATEGGCMGVDLLAVLPEKLNPTTAALTNARSSRRSPVTVATNPIEVVVPSGQISLRCADGRRFDLRFPYGREGKSVQVKVDGAARSQVYETRQGASGVGYEGPPGYWISSWHDQWSYLKTQENPPHSIDCKEVR